MADFTFRGTKEVSRRVIALAKRSPAAGRRALRGEGEDITTAAKSKHVPVDLGTLRASGRTVEAKRTISVRIVFGNAAAPYALAVHETPSQYDPPSWRGRTVSFSPAGTGSKYLEKPLRAAIAGMDKRIANAMAADLGL